MDFAPNALDYGNAVEVHANGLKSVTLISENVVRISLYANYPRPAGGTEQRVSLYITMDLDDYLASGAPAQKARASLCERRAWSAPRVAAVN